LGKYLEKKLSLIKQIPAGYKKSELGVIPKDWEVDKLSNVAPLQRGFDLPTSQIKKGPFPVVYSNGILNFHHKAMAKAPGVVTGRSGTIGKVNYIEKDYWPHNTTLWVTNFKGNNEKYVYFLYSHIQIERFRTGSGVPTLNRNDVHDFQVSIPKSKSEQTAIATVLSDTDALIEHLEKLIAKKKAIKQGMMQQLLTSKKRLPGFSRDWKVKKLGEVGETYGGLSGKKKSDFDGGKYPYIPFMNIMSNPVIDLQYFDYVNIRGDEKQNRAIKGDLFFNGSSETPEEVGMCSVLQGDIPNLYLNSFCFGFRLNKDLKTDGLYLSYFFRSPMGRQLIFSLAQGATRYNLSKINFMKLEIPYPNLAEQITIAKIFSDMDAEIESLEQKRDKYTMLKQGMMQQLLTGRIRIYANN
jgi:type I restriction enzyme S subunit